MGRPPGGTAAVNPARRLLDSFRQDGVAATLVKGWAVAVDHWFDRKYGVDTCSWSNLRGLTITGDNREKAYDYRPTRVLPLRRVFGALRPLFSPQSVLVDIGSGKGRVLLAAAEFGFRHVRGVEFAHELCEIARQNVARYKVSSGTKTSFEIIEADATQREVADDEDVFIMYNPFDDTVLKAVLDRIARSLSRRPRKVLIIYYNPRWSAVFEGRGDYFKVRELDFWSFKFAVYSNQPG
jgi:SAM-dependent methyltransferase